MSKHTPGPWALSGPFFASLTDEATHQLVQFEICGGDYSAGGKYFSLSGGINRATARLIAAAPELLEACKRAIPKIHDDESTTNAEVFELLRSAIAKAEGGAE